MLTSAEVELSSSAFASTNVPLTSNESIQLFTLANFDTIDGFFENANHGGGGDSKHQRTQNNISALPDLMKDTMQLEAEHHNVCIINKELANMTNDNKLIYGHEAHLAAALCGTLASDSSDRSFRLSPYNAYTGPVSTFFMGNEYVQPINETVTTATTTTTGHIWLPGGSLSTGEASSVHTTTDDTNESQSTFLIEDSNNGVQIIETPFNLNN